LEHPLSISDDDLVLNPVMRLPTNPDPDLRSQWKLARSSIRHECAPGPVPADVPKGSLWKCPTCRRGWRLMSKPVPGEPRCPAWYSEGVPIKGDDGAVYWRASRMRFIGRLGV